MAQVSNFNDSSERLLDDHHTDPYLASDEEIPTVDYSLLLSNHSDQRSLAIEHLRYACQEYGCFYLVNHTIPDEVLNNLLKGVPKFFNPKTIDERKIYSEKDPSDKIRWEIIAHEGENREYIKAFTHPEYHYASNLSGLSNKCLEEHCKEMRKIIIELAKAMSETLGFEEHYIENAFILKLGFDVTAMNLYPPNSSAKGDIGIPQHTDPSFVISLVQDVNGGLQILSHKRKWINVYIPHHAILIQLGDHIEVLTNGKYKSSIHRVVVNNNKLPRITVVTLHGPSLDKYIIPGSEFVDEGNPQKYRGMTYKESLEARGGTEIDIHSPLEKLKLV